jgi:hypothetical protein
MDGLFVVSKSNWSRMPGKTKMYLQAIKAYCDLPPTFLSRILGDDADYTDFLILLILDPCNPIIRTICDSDD